MNKRHRIAKRLRRGVWLHGVTRDCQYELKSLSVPSLEDLGKARLWIAQERAPARGWSSDLIEFLSCFAIGFERYLLKEKSLEFFQWQALVQDHSAHVHPTIGRPRAIGGGCTSSATTEVALYGAIGAFQPVGGVGDRRVVIAVKQS